MASVENPQDGSQVTDIMGFIQETTFLLMCPINKSNRKLSRAQKMEWLFYNWICEVVIFLIDLTLYLEEIDMGIDFEKKISFLC